MQAVEKHTQEILDAHKYLWEHPQTGYNERLAEAYLAERFEKAGYVLRMAGNIPGFTAVLDTGRPGPRVLVLGELDSLVCFEHPECDKETGAVHACGHSAQSAALLGIALALKEPGIMDKLSGSICLCAVPAEELIELEAREALKEQGIISYFGGKVEFLHRGYFDGCDMAILIHTAGEGVKYGVNAGSNGCVLKQMEYTGKSSHAGGAPHQGINALYAATAGFNAVNALRETFVDDDHIRFHPILTSGGTVVNAIPARATAESYVRGATLEAIRDNNTKINRALAASAAAFGAQLRIRDLPGYTPLNNDFSMAQVAAEAGQFVFDDDTLGINDEWSTGCTDMGDLSAVMPTVQPYIGGASGIGHGKDYAISDPVTACMRSAQVQLVMLSILLRDGAARAVDVLAKARPYFPSVKAYFEAIDSFRMDREVVSYEENGDVVLSLHK